MYNVGNCGFAIYKAAYITFRKNGWDKNKPLFTIGPVIERRDSDMLFWPDYAIQYTFEYKEYDTVLLWLEENFHGLQLNAIALQTKVDDESAEY